MFWTLLLSLMFWGKTIFAAGEFTSIQNTNYNFDPQGNSTVTHNLSIKNLFSTIYAKEFNLKISSNQLANIQAYDEFGDILKSITKSNQNTIINIAFSHPSIGKNQEKKFTISYQEPLLAVSKGALWQIILPEVANDFLEKSTISVKSPTSWGNLAISSQKPQQQFNDNFFHTTIFENSKKNNPKISLSFGQAQVFKFNLIYNLENTSQDLTQKTISIPPDTQLQRIHYQNLDPLPETIKTDLDGNWIATYTLKPSESKIIKISGLAKIFQNIDYPQPEPNQIKNALIETKTWPISSPKIQSLISNLKTPKDIYNYTVNTLNYDYTRLNNSKKLSVNYILDHPNEALCTEFTDLFITLARAKGLAAREIIGYAQTNNLESRPINQNADILHAWPQYYDPIQRSWKDIDPTWGKTTNGIDYFTNLDLNHLAFVIHSQNDSDPAPPGAYRGPLNQKTVNVDYSAENQQLTYFKPKITLKSLSWDKLNLEVTNPNYHALYQVTINSQILPLLAPFETKNISVPFNFSLIPETELKINFEGQGFIQNLKLYPLIYLELFFSGIGVILLAFFAIITLNKK